MQRASNSVSSVLLALWLVTGTVAFVLAVVEGQRGEQREVWVAFLVCLGAYALAWWFWGDPLYLGWLGCALLAAGFATDGSWLSAAFAVAVLLAMVVVGIQGSVRLIRDVSSIPLDRVGADAVMPESEANVARFEEAGFRRMGGYAATIDDKHVVFNVLLGPDADRFAIVTDTIVQVVSMFGGRFFVTTGVGTLPMPRDVLRQRPGYGTDVIPAHQTAVELLARRGLEPDLFERDAEALQAALALEARAADFLSGAPLLNVFRYMAKRGTVNDALVDDSRSRRRIDAWLASQPSVAS